MARTTVFLDYGGTLARVPEMYEQPWAAWSYVLEAHRCVVPADHVRRALSDTNRELISCIYDYVGRIDAYWRIYDDRVLDRLGIHEQRSEVERSIEEVFGDPSTIRLYPEVPQVLRDLRAQGYRLGVVSNHTDGLLRVLGFHGLADRFDTITYSQEAGAEKPDPKIFRLALLRAGCSAEEAVHVGDSVQADVEGARRVGIAPVWVNRRQEDGPADCPTISDLSGLLAALARLA